MLPLAMQSEMEVDGDTVDVGVDYNEFEDEPASSTKNEEVKIHEQEMDIDNPDVLIADKPYKCNEIVDELPSDDRPRHGVELEITEKVQSKENTKARRSERKGNHSRQNTERRRDSNRSNKPKSKLFKILDASPDLDPKILGREIAYRLEETKVGLIINVVKVLGFGKTMEILEETKKIEKMGGMLTADKKRRRSPGGVFIFCLKEMGFASKEQVKEIFKDEKLKLKEIIKRKRKEKNAKQREELSKLKELKERAMKYLNNMVQENAEVKEIETGEIDESLDKVIETIETEKVEVS